MAGKYAWRNSSVPGIRTMRRLPSGIRVAVDRNGVEWDIYRTDDDGTVKPYWLATDGNDGYLEAMTLRMVLADVGKAARTDSAPVWRDYSNERGARPTFATCRNCSGYPIGTGCYHICPNSVHYYSPEQERYDDAMDDGSDDIRERYAATIEPSQYYDEGDYEDEPDVPIDTEGLTTLTIIDTSDDIPF